MTEGSRTFISKWQQIFSAIEEVGLIRSMRPGLIQLEIGVQSANEETVREIKRTMKLEKVRDRVGQIKENGNVHQHLDLIARPAI